MHVSIIVFYTNIMCQCLNKYIPTYISILYNTCMSQSVTLGMLHIIVLSDSVM